MNVIASDVDGLEKISALFTKFFDGDFDDFSLCIIENKSILLHIAFHHFF